MGEPKTRRKRPNRQQEVDAHDRMLRALELRKAGVQYREIATTLGYAGPSGAHKAVMSALKSTLREPAEDVKQLELDRLDAMHLALWRQAQAGDERAIARVLTIMERRSRLLGLDEPKRSEVTGADGEPLIPATTADLAARFEQLVRDQHHRLREKKAKA